MIKGLNALTRQLGEVEKAAAALDGTIAMIKFDPSDVDSVKNAICEMERAVDQKVSRYRNNPLVADIVKATKAIYSDAIRAKVRRAEQA